MVFFGALQAPHIPYVPSIPDIPTATVPPLILAAEAVSCNARRKNRLHPHLAAEWCRCGTS